MQYALSDKSPITLVKPRKTTKSYVPYRTTRTQCTLQSVYNTSDNTSTIECLYGRAIGVRENQVWISLSQASLRHEMSGDILIVWAVI